MGDFNRKYDGLFDKAGEEVSEEDEDTTETEGEDTSPIKKFMKQWGWIYNVDNVAQTMRISWDDVFNKTVVEFFNVLAYTKDRNNIEKEREKEYLKKLKR